MAVIACHQEEKTLTEGALTLSAQPQAGDEIVLQYSRSKSSIGEESDLQLTLYYTVEGIIYAENIPISDSDGLIRSTFHLPDSAQAFALKFHSEHTDRNRGKGYVFPVCNSIGHPVKGALVGASLFYNTRQSLLRLSQQPDTALQLIQSEFDAFPDEKDRWMNLYLNTLIQGRKDKAYSEVEDHLQKILSAEHVEDKAYHMAYNLFEKMGKKEKANAVKSIGLQKYPNGILARYDALGRFNNQNNIDSMLSEYRSFKERFINDSSDSKTMRLADVMGSRIALYYSKHDRYSEYLELVSELKSPLEKASDYINVATSLLGTKTKLKFADSLMSISLPLIRIAMNVPGKGKPTYITKESWKKQMRRSYGLNADTYAAILFEEGKVKAAAGYQRIAVGIFGGKKKDVNERYIKYLMADKKWELAKKQMSGFLSGDYVTPKMKEYLKRIDAQFISSDSLKLRK